MTFPRSQSDWASCPIATPLLLPLHLLFLFFLPPTPIPLVFCPLLPLSFSPSPILLLHSLISIFSSPLTQKTKTAFETSDCSVCVLLYIYKILQNLTPTAGPSRNLAASRRKIVAVYLVSSSGFWWGMFSIHSRSWGRRSQRKQYVRKTTRLHQAGVCPGLTWGLGSM